MQMFLGCLFWSPFFIGNVVYSFRLYWYYFGCICTGIYFSWGVLKNYSKNSRRMTIWVFEEFLLSIATAGFIIKISGSITIRYLLRCISKFHQTVCGEVSIFWRDRSLVCSLQLCKTLNMQHGHFHLRFYKSKLFNNRFQKIIWKISVVAYIVVLYSI